MWSKATSDSRAIYVILADSFHLYNLTHMCIELPSIAEPDWRYHVGLLR